MRKIKIFDTTLRDGEQTPGVNYSIEQKMQIAKQLESMGVDIIEAGFPITSQADFDACKKIGEEIKDSRVAYLARLNKKDIDRAYEAGQQNPNVILHTVIATSDIHMKHKLKMSEDELVEKIRELITYSKTLFKDIEFSAEDASRSDKDFLVRCFQTAIDCGANTINIPDTVGFARPDQMRDLVRYIKDNINAEGVTISTHIHQDLGLATANSLAAIEGGCDQIECAINGLGERAGNTSLEEVVCALKIHQEHYQAYTDIDLKQINDASVLVATCADIIPQPNKAIVGRNAFLHESGIHQDGFLKARETYEIINPEMIGKSINECIVIGKHSGKHAMSDWLDKNGYATDAAIVDAFYVDVKKATDVKKNLSIHDLHEIIKGILNVVEEDLPSDYKVDKFKLTYEGSDVIAKISLSNEDGEYYAEQKDETPIKAIFGAIDQAIDFHPKLTNYHIDAINLGSDSKGMVEAKISSNNHDAAGYGLSQDILVASIDAYVNAINKIRGEINE